MESIPHLLNSNNDNVSNITKNNNVIERAKKIDLIAVRLVEKFFGNIEEPKRDKSWQFYCKVAWSLSEAQIWQNVELAKTKKNPPGYFNYLCRLQMGEAENRLSQSEKNNQIYWRYKKLTNPIEENPELNGPVRIVKPAS